MTIKIEVDGLLKKYEDNDSKNLAKASKALSEKDTWHKSIIDENGTILVNCLHILNLFSNKMDIIDILFEKYIDCNEPTQIFITDNYINIMINDNVDIKESFVDYIIERLKYRNKPYWYDRIRKIIQNLTKDSKWYMRLHTAFNVDIEEMPFKIEADDLPF